MTSIGVESWIWYGVVTTVLLLRYIARYLHFKSVLKFQIEDYFMLFVFCLYTVLIEMLNICATVSTNLINPEDIPHLTPQDKSDREYGSKCVLVVESCMCAVQWGTKACLLLLYWRLTENLRQAMVVKLAAVYVLLTYVIMISLYYGYWCRPFHVKFWAVPTSDIQCATQIHHLIVNLAFNLSSDILIMSIPLPLFLRARLEWKKKLLLVLPFSLGIFTIICAILSKHLSFTQPFSGEWVFWYTREASTAMIVTNMPYSWAIFRRVFNVKHFLATRGSEDMPADTGNRINGISMDDNTRAQQSTVQGEGSIKSSRPGIFRSYSNALHRLSSRVGNSTKKNADMATSDDLPVLEGKTHDGIIKVTDFGDSPEGSSNGAAIAYQAPVPLDERRNVAAVTVPAVSDVDRLYRLDDESEYTATPRLSVSRGYEPKVD